MLYILITSIVLLFGFISWELSAKSRRKLDIDDEDDCWDEEILRKHINNSINSKIVPASKIQNDVQQKYIPIPQQLRRFQSSLKEYSKELIKKDEEQLHRDREQTILQQLLTLGERHVQIGNVMADLRMKEVDVFSREKNIELKTEFVKLLLERVQLDRQGLENSRKEALIDIREGMHEVEKQKTLLEYANERLSLNNLVSEIVQREHVLELDLKRQDIQEAALALIGKNNELNFKAGMLGLKSERVAIEELAVAFSKREKFVEISEQKLGLQKIDIELTQRENNAELREGKISLDRQMLNLMADKNVLEEGKRMLHYGNEELKLKNLNSEITNGKTTLELLAEKNALNEGKRMLQYGNEELKLKDTLSDINTGKKSLELIMKQLTISDQESRVEAGKREIEFGKRELSLGAEKLEHTQRVITFKVQTSMQELKNQINSLQFEKKSWNLQQREEKMKMYHTELRQLDTHIRQMYSVKSEWLKIQARENKLDTREQRIQLDNLYRDTQSKIKELHLTRWENNMIWDKKEMERRWDIMNYLEEWWFYNDGYRPERRTLEHYQKAGYAAQSPLVQENNELRWLLSEMERKKLK